MTKLYDEDADKDNDRYDNDYNRPVSSFQITADVNDCRFILYSLSLVFLLKIQKYLRERAKSHLQQYTQL